MITKLKYFFAKPLSYQSLHNVLSERITQDGFEKTKVWAIGMVEVNKVANYDVNRALFTILKDSRTAEAIPFGQAALREKFTQELSDVVESRVSRVAHEQAKAQRQWLNSLNVTGLTQFAADNDIVKTEKWLNEAVTHKPDIALTLYKTFFTIYKKSHAKVALPYGKKAVELGADGKFAEVVKVRERWVSKLAG